MRVTNLYLYTYNTTGDHTSFSAPELGKKIQAIPWGNWRWNVILPRALMHSVLESGLNVADEWTYNLWMESHLRTYRSLFITEHVKCGNDESIESRVKSPIYFWTPDATIALCTLDLAAKKAIGPIKYNYLVLSKEMPELWNCLSRVLVDYQR